MRCMQREPVGWNTDESGGGDRGGEKAPVCDLKI